MQNRWQSGEAKPILIAESKPFEARITKFSEIYRELESRDIVFDIKKIGFNEAYTDAITFQFSNGKYAIVIDTSNMEKTPEIKSVIAHEIGHCATGCTHRLDSPLDLIDQHEYKANKWAVERFLPYNDIKTAFIDGYTEVWELAEHFSVSEELMRWALYYYTECKGYSFQEPA